MKIYRFNPETGAYLGEDFADEKFMLHEKVLADDATTIAPPDVDHGQFLFFSTRMQCWEIRSNPELRPSSERP